MGGFIFGFRIIMKRGDADTLPLCQTLAQGFGCHYTPNQLEQHMISGVLLPSSARMYVRYVLVLDSWYFQLISLNGKLSTIRPRTFL
jgi:hypothetical protein